MPGIVLVIEDELLFSTRIENGLRANGFQPRLVTNADQVAEALKAFPVLALVNVGSPETLWEKAIQVLRARRPNPPPTVVGYGPHVDPDLRQLALTVGCAAVVARSAVVSDLDTLLVRYAWRPDRTTCDQLPPDGVIKGIDQFNSQAFFRSHDSIEAVWVEEARDVRVLYQGLLQVGVGFYHIQRRNHRGAAKMLARGKGKLLPFLPSCQGIDVENFLAQVNRCEEDLHDVVDSDSVDRGWFPRIRVAE